MVYLFSLQIDNCTMSSIIEKFEGPSITEEMLSAAATLFSRNYGVWDPLAVEKMGSFAKQGKHIFLTMLYLCNTNKRNNQVRE